MRTILVAVCALSTCACAKADLVEIEYFDSASDPAFGGPLWRATVDTVTDRIEFTSWTEFPRHSVDFWVPANLPMVWRAVDANGVRFDVPDTFGLNGVVEFGSDDDPANDFAFVSPRAMQDINWHPFDAVAGEPDRTQVVNFTGSVLFFPGWGGYAFQVPGGNLTFLTAQPNPESSDTEFDQRAMPALPVSALDVRASTNATLTVISRTVTPEAVIVSVPEASAVAGGVLISTLVCLRRRAGRRPLGNAH